MRNKAYWNYLVSDFLQVDLMAQMEEEKMHEQESKMYTKSKGLTIVEEEKEKTPRISDESPNELKIDDSEESEKRSIMPKTKS